MEIKRIGSDETELVAHLFDKYRSFYKQKPDVQLARNFLQQRLDNTESIIFVAIDNVDGNQNPVGFTQLYPTYSSVRAIKNWILNDLYVSSEWRKQGIGEKLLRTAIQFAKDTGAKYLQLETAVDNFTAQSLYEQTGFIKQTPDTDYYVYRFPIE